MRSTRSAALARTTWTMRSLRTRSPGSAIAPRAARAAGALRPPLLRAAPFFARASRFSLWPPPAFARTSRSSLGTAPFLAWPSRLVLRTAPLFAWTSWCSLRPAPLLTRRPRRSWTSLVVAWTSPRFVLRTSPFFTRTSGRPCTPATRTSRLLLRTSRPAFRTSRFLSPALACFEPGTFLVAADLEARAGVRVIAARPPVTVAPAVAAGATLRLQRLERRFRRVPELPAVEPAQRDVGLRVLQLLQRRNQLLGIAGAKGRRRRAGDDHPERVAAGHG